MDCTGLTVACGLVGGSSAALLAFGFAAGAVSGAAGAGSLDAGTGGAAAESAGGFVASLDAAVSAGGELGVVVPVGVFVAGLAVTGLAVAGLPAAAAGSGAACGGAVGVAGALVLFEAGGVAELVSGASELCAAAEGLFVCEPNHPNA